MTFRDQQESPYPEIMAINRLKGCSLPTGQGHHLVHLLKPDQKGYLDDHSANNPKLQPIARLCP